MPEYLTPGVYIEEKPGAKPIEGVGTATGAFIGIAEKGPIGEAKLITNWTQFVETFGGFIPPGYLAYAVNQFFAEGGTRCYVVRTCHYDYTTPLVLPAADAGSIILQDTSLANTLKIDALSPGSWSDHVWIEIADAIKDSANKFRLVVWYKGMEVESFEELTKGDVIGKINGISKYIKVDNEGTSILAPHRSAQIINDWRIPTAPTLGITALEPGLTVVVGNHASNQFVLLVMKAGVVVDRLVGLSMNNIEFKVNGVSSFIKVKNLNPKQNNLPKTTSMILNDRAIPNALPTLAVTALADGLSLSVADGTDPDTFMLTVTGGSPTPEVFNNLTMDNAESAINGVSNNIDVRNLKSATDAPDNRPDVTTAPLILFNPKSSILNDRATPDALQTLEVTAIGNGLSLIVEDGSTPGTFRLIVTRGTVVLETFDDQIMADVETNINGVSSYITVRDLESTTASPNNQPAATIASLFLNDPDPLNFFVLNGGDDGLDDGITLDDATTPIPGESLQVNAFREEIKVKIEDATSGADKFKLTVLANDVEVETFDNLVMDTVQNTINGTSRYIELAEPETPSGNRPANTLNATGDPIAVEVPIGLADMDFIGDEATKNGLHAFDTVDDINILAIPDWPGDREVILAAYTYCQNRRDCFFVADSPVGLDPQGVLAFKEGDNTYDGGIFAGNAFNSSYAALYYPWINVTDPLTGQNKLVPPSGAVVGTYSGTDVLRGVHKAPAGTIDGYLNSAVGIERLVTKGEQALLNPEHINVIRKFPGAGIVIWGARTLSADPEWRYVNVRRLLLFLEESIEEASQWVVFEPNDRSLWATVKRDVTAFLTIVWRSGALFGASEDEAFFVKIDDENNPPEMRAVGRLIIDIGVAPVKPAEFVIFRISQKTQATG